MFEQMCLFNIELKDFKFIACLSCAITNSLILYINGSIKVIENKTGLGWGSEGESQSAWEHLSCVMILDLIRNLKFWHYGSVISPVTKGPFVSWQSLHFHYPEFWDEEVPGCPELQGSLVPLLFSSTGVWDTRCWTPVLINLSGK